MPPIDSALREIAIHEIKLLEKRLGALDRQRESVLREMAIWRLKAKEGDKPEYATNNGSVVASSETSKTPSETTRELINSAGTEGIKPKELTQALRNLGHNVSESFASTTLFRMKQNVEVIVYESRYYLVRFAPSLAIAAQSKKSVPPTR